MTDISEYEALRAGRGFVDLAGWSSITVSGADRQAFLNKFCTNDVKRLQPGDSCEAFFTNVKGRIIGHGFVVCGNAKLEIVGTPGQASSLVAHLDRYVIREDVQISDTTNDRALFLVTGVSHQSRPNGTIEWKLMGDLSCDLRLVNQANRKILCDTLIAEGLVACSLAAFETLRIEAGAPLFGVDFDERNFPQEIGRDREAISFTKGCYLGQETVARIDALGHVNQRIVRVRFDGTVVPAAGAELIADGAVVGRVMSATFSPKFNTPLALAMVRREHTGAGSRLDSRYGTGSVVELPAASA
jgi:folate-binding protein YgfZ